MAHCSQHPVQSMENKNHFDLEKALLTWREDFASRSGISLEAARELESDLRERVADLQKQGLNENEAFRKALHQVGSPGALAREFARENPWAVWHDRFLWMITAGFAVSIWQIMSYRAISWLLQAFGDSLPFYLLFHLSAGVAVTLGANLPLLLIAILLATGRLGKLAGSFHHFLQSRRQLVLTGMGLLVVAVYMMLFGLNEWSPLYLITTFVWPLALLSLGIFLFRPSNAISARSPFQMKTAFAAVWRERVCWMAVGGLIVGFWQIVSSLGIRALFSTRDFNKPFNVGLVMGLQLLAPLSPAILLLLLGQRVRRGMEMPGETLVRRRPLLAALPVVLSAWAGMQLWPLYSGIPRDRGVTFPDVLTHYLTTFQWLWPVGLALLLLWLAPDRLKQEQDSEFAK